jgi:uncharacterized SAM-binding protein YcdF (DUF218 family)
MEEIKSSIDSIESFEEIREHLKIVLDFLIDATPNSELPEVDAIFIFGHIDPRVAKQAVLVWNLNKAKKIIVSGKKRLEIPNSFETEAEFYTDILKKNNVPENSIILEKEATNTLENVLFGMNKIINEGENIESLIICSLPPQLRRSRATFIKNFPNIKTYGSTFDTGIEDYMKLSIIKRLIGEFDRFDEYFEKGDIDKVEIPENVEFAVNRIKDFLRGK